MSKSWDKLQARDRVIAVHVDISQNKDFAQLSGFTYIGSVKIDKNIPTAGTNGRDVWYGEDFTMGLTRKQLRFVVAHESLHKALQHCILYPKLCEQYPLLTNIAMDYVVNGTIDEIDPTQSFVEWTTNPKPLIDAKYRGWSFIEVFRDLLNNTSVISVGGEGQPLDEHKVGEVKGDGEIKEHQRQCDDALRQGKILADKLAGKISQGGAIDRVTQKRDTAWREHMRDWITALCEGDEYSRFAPPNKRLLPLGILMPSHFSEATGELIINADTSGSMSSIYGILFGEIARIAEHVKPDGVRVIWWDSAVCGEQYFKPHEFGRIAELLKPSGGGGTSPECVVQYITEKKYTPKGVVWLTDGYLDGSNANTGFPTLWGVVDNDHFVPSEGKVVRIYSN